MSNQFKIYAHPDFDCAITGKASGGHHPPQLIDKATSMEIAAVMAFSWVCRTKHTGDGSPFSANTPERICNVWPLRAPSGERWYIAASKTLETPITQEVNGSPGMIEEVLQNHLDTINFFNNSSLEKQIKKAINDYLESATDEMVARMTNHEPKSS